MRIQTLLHQGPFDGHMMSISTVEGEAPKEIRIASGDDHEDPVEAHLYRRHNIEKGTIWMGSYKFTHSFESKRTLIDYFV